MKFLLEHLRTFTDLPATTHDARELLDDVGIEVKASDTSSLGTVFSIELLANRGDHYCYAGVAREVSGRTGLALRFPPVASLNQQRSTAEDLRIETPLCLVYTLTELSVREESAAALPDGVLGPLIAADIHSINVAVDASNLTNLDFGQPTHAFDADKVDGPIIVRLSRAGEKAWMLFTDEPIGVPEGTLVIADRSKIIGIAGVIGCVEAAVTRSTRRILLESATFDPAAVRISSRTFNQATDAAARFMRGGDPTLPLIGAARVGYLLQTYSGYRIGTTWTATQWEDPRREITIHVPQMQRFLGADISANDMADRLARYGFGIPSTVAGGSSQFVVVVPPHRLWDVYYEADLAEELLKSVGYNNTAVSLPSVSMGALPSHEENVAARVNNILVAEGFYEVFTNSFYGRRVRERLGLTESDPRWPHLEVQNSIEKDYSLLRNNTLAQALESLAINLNLRTVNVKMYEWARIYFADASEQRILWGLVNGRDRGPYWADKGRLADAIYIKGILEQLRLDLRVDIGLGASDGHPLERFFHPGRRAGIYVGGALHGIVGQPHPAVLQRFDIPRQRPVYFEMQTAGLFAAPLPKTYEDPPSRQPVVRNVAYSIPHGITAGEVRDVLAAAGPPLLRAIEITDLFELPGANAVTFELEYLAPRALTNQEVNAATETMNAAVGERFGGRVALRT